MRIARLKLERFGTFENATLEFTDARPLTVVFGPNEAGKSTLLAAVHALLFGFPHQTPYAFRFEPSTLAIAATLRFADGTAAEVRRTKGRKETLRGTAGGTEVSSEWLERRLGNASEGLFSTVFGFSLAELAAGGEALERGQVRDAFFGGGAAGSAAPDRILKALDEEMAALFKERGSTPSINAAARAIKEAKREIREAAVRGSDWTALDEAVKTRRQDLETARREVKNFSAEKQRLERDLKAIGLVRRLEAIDVELAAVPVATGLSAEARVAFEKLLAELSVAGKAVEDLEGEESSLRDRLSQLQPNAALLAAGETVERLHAELKSVRDARRDRPSCERERDGLTHKLTEELAALGPAWTLAKLEGPDTTLRTRASFQRNAARWRELDRRVQEARAQVKSLESALREHEAKLARLEPTRDLSFLVPLLPAVREVGERELERKQFERRLPPRRANVAAARRRLSPILPLNREGAETLLLPRDEQVQPFLAEWDRLQADARGLELRRSDLAERRRRLEGDISVAGPRTVPTLDELRAARERRQTGWSLVRRAWLQGEDVREEARAYAPGAELPGAYERAVEKADAVADAMREHADEVAQAEVRETESRRLRCDQAAFDEDFKGHEARRSDFDARWRSLWEPAGVRPDSPAVMSAWLKDHAELARASEELAADAASLAALDAKDRACEAELRAALGRPETALAQLCEELRRLEEDEKSRASRAGELRELVAADRGKLEAAREEARVFEDEARRLEAAWRRDLQAHDFDPTLSIEEAEALTTALDKRRLEASGLPGLRQRIESMTSAIVAFETEASGLVSSSSRELEGLAAEAAVERLFALLKQAREAYKERREKEGRLAEVQRKLPGARARVDQVEAALSSWRQKAAAADDATFLEAADQAMRAADLHKETAGIVQSLDQLRSTESVVELRARLSGGDPSELDALLRQAEGALAEAEKRRDTCSNELGAAEQRLRAIDGSSRAADVQAGLESHRARLSRDVERYAVLAAARRFLDDELKRFERENQPVLLGRASALFREMTRGRYREVYRRLDEGGTLVAVAAEGSAERTAGQMSTGTREQLYLALRLAYIEHYARSCEPLPVVLDDVLVNFDDERAKATIEALAGAGLVSQVLLFTCHEHLVRFAEEVVAGLEPVIIDGARQELTR